MHRLSNYCVGVMWFFQCCGRVMKEFGGWGEVQEYAVPAPLCGEGLYASHAECQALVGVLKRCGGFWRIVEADGQLRSSNPPFAHSRMAGTTVQSRLAPTPARQPTPLQRCSTDVHAIRRSRSLTCKISVIPA